VKFRDEEAPAPSRAKQTPPERASASPSRSKSPSRPRSSPGEATAPRETPWPRPSEEMITEQSKTGWSGTESRIERELRQLRKKLAEEEACSITGVLSPRAEELEMFIRVLENSLEAELPALSAPPTALALPAPEAEQERSRPSDDSVNSYHRRGVSASSSKSNSHSRSPPRHSGPRASSRNVHVEPEAESAAARGAGQSGNDAAQSRRYSAAAGKPAGQVGKESPGKSAVPDVISAKRGASQEKKAVSPREAEPAKRGASQEKKAVSPREAEPAKRGASQEKKAVSPREAEPAKRGASQEKKAVSPREAQLLKDPPRNASSLAIPSSAVASASSGPRGRKLSEVFGVLDADGTGVVPLEMLEALGDCCATGSKAAWNREKHLQLVERLKRQGCKELNEGKFVDCLSEHLPTVHIEFLDVVGNFSEGAKKASRKGKRSASKASATESKSPSVSSSSARSPAKEAARPQLPPRQSSTAGRSSDRGDSKSASQDAPRLAGSASARSAATGSKDLAKDSTKQTPSDKQSRSPSKEADKSDSSSYMDKQLDLLMGSAV